VSIETLSGSFKGHLETVRLIGQKCGITSKSAATKYFKLHLICRSAASTEKEASPRLNFVQSNQVSRITDGLVHSLVSVGWRLESGVTSMKSIMYEPRPLSLQVLELGFIDISGGNFPLLLNIAQDFVGYLGFQKYLAPHLDSITLNNSLKPLYDHVQRAMLV
jgi:hypothetical protein